MTQGHKNFGKAWRERIPALRNRPPVLAIVWRSGPTVVTLGLVFRLIASLQPIALLYVSKLIIDSIVNILSRHQPIPAHLWWLVAAEFLIAVLGNVLTRILDYLDSLLADKYTRHVSIQVMKHAAELDLIAYEDPVFYDRLERARVQATDRLAMIQMLGRLIQQAITTITLSASIIYFSPWLLLLLIAGVLPAFVGESHFAFQIGNARPADPASDHHDHAFGFDHLLLALAAAALDCRRSSRLRRRKPLCLSRLCQEFPADAGAPATRLSAGAGRQQGSGQGAEALRVEQIPYRALYPAFRPGL